MEKGSPGGIPKDMAMSLCDEIRATKEKRLFSQCWGCVKASKGDFSNMCASSQPDFRGCGLVNKRYDQMLKNERPG